MVASGLRSLLTIGPGPDDGGSKLNQRPHMPDKSGMDTPLFISPLGGSATGINVCVRAGMAAAAAAKMINAGRPWCLCMLTSSCCLSARHLQAASSGAKVTRVDGRRARRHAHSLRHLAYRPPSLLSPLAGA